MHRFLLPLALLAACEGDSDDTDDGDVTDHTDHATDTDTDTTTPPVDDGWADVLRDCEPTIGNICPWVGAGYNGVHLNGDATHQLDAWFSFPMSVAFDAGGGRPVLFDWNNHRIRAVNPDPNDGLETIMGTQYLGDGDPDAADKTPAGAQGTLVALNHPTMGQFYSDGILLADTWHTHKFRTWDPATGLVHVVLGDRPGWGNVDFDQPEASVLMNQPKELFIDPIDENIVYYIDMRNERIRMWDGNTGLVSTIAGNGNKGAPGLMGTTPATPPAPVACAPDPQVAIKGADAVVQPGTCFSFPKNGNPEPGGAIAVTSDATKMYIADSEAHLIRMLDLTTGIISTISGTPAVHGDADGPAATATWYYPADFALDESTNELFVADANNHKIRKIDLTTMMVSTVVGTGEPTCDIVDLLIPATCANQHDAGDGGPATEATVYRPFGVDINPDGNLVITDTYDHRFRIVYRY
jgi:hypothetical protein